MVPRIGALLVRLAALTLAWAVVVCVGLAEPARAHDGVDVTVHTDGAGGVWATVTWADGHPVAEHITALVTATSPQGQRVGPEAMTAGAAAGTVSYAGTLAAGQWLVSVDVAPAGRRALRGGRPGGSDQPARHPDAVPGPALTDGGRRAHRVVARRRRTGRGRAGRHHRGDRRRRALAQGGAQASPQGGARSTMRYRNLLT